MNSVKYYYCYIKIWPAANLSMLMQGNDKADQVQDFIATDLKQQIVFMHLSRNKYKQTISI